MLELGVIAQLPCIPHPRQGPFSAASLRGFLLLCSPPRWEDGAERGAETSGATHHIRHFDSSKREDDGIGRGGHRQHEGQGGGQSAREHDIERMEADALSLEGETVGRVDGIPYPRGKGVAPNTPASHL